MVDLVQYWLRRYTSTEWEESNPILGDGQLGLATDIDLFKVGDGVSHWLDLPNMGQHVTEHLNQMSASQAASRFLAKLKANKSDAKMLFLTDSTGASYLVETGWTRQVVIRLGERFEEITVKFREWNGNVSDVGGSESWDAWETLQEGTGPYTLWVSNGAVGGTNTRYPLARLQAMVVEPDPDLIVIGHGGNELAETSMNTKDTIRSTYLCLTQALMRAVPDAALILCSQQVIPEVEIPAVSDPYMMMENIALVAMLTGSGFVNQTLEFAALGDDVVDYLLVDEIHCNQLGHNLWADTFWNQAFSIDTPPVNFQRQSSFVVPIARNLLNNGQFTSFVPPAAPVGWVAANVTMSKDTVHTTGENGNGWSLKMVSLDTGVSVIQQSVNAYLLALYKGQYVTACCKSRLETPLPDFVSGKGVVTIYDGVSYSAGIPDRWSDDEFVYHAITHKVSDVATQIKVEVICESAAAVAGTTTEHEWVTLVPGLMPSAPMAYDHAAALYDHMVDALAAHAASAISYAGSADLAATTVEAALDELDAEKAPGPDSGWQTITLPTPTNWVHFGGGSATPEYRKIAGRVELKGALKNGTATAGTTLFTLPVGYRPLAIRYYLAWHGGGVTQLTVDSTGAVKISLAGVNNAVISLDGVSFLAEA